MPHPPAADAGIDAVPLEDAIVLPDVADVDGAVPGVCRRELKPVRLFDDPRKNFTVAVPNAATVKAVAVTSPGALTSAAALSVASVAGLVTTRAPATTTTDVVAELETTRARFVTGLRASDTGIVTVRTSGIVGKSYDGSPDIKAATWVVKTQSSTEPGRIRNALMAAAIGRQEAALVAPPLTRAPAVSSFVVKVTVVSRGGRIVTAAGVMGAVAYDAPAGTAFADADDFGNGTNVAAYGSLSALECDRARISGRARADVIWVIDESGSMRNNREAIMNSAGSFYSRATASGLDFRMAVTGMGPPTDPQIIQGKFCSEPSADQGSEGGTDRFLLPAERTKFTGCVENPPFLATRDEFGISGAFHAVERHLPRAANDPKKIRTGAALALIIVTDEAPAELKQNGSFQGRGGFLVTTDYRSAATCSLTGTKKAQLDKFNAPLLEYFRGTKNPETTATIHLIGGGCKSSCAAELPYSYKELASGTGGLSGDICQNNLGATLQAIIDSIVASASPRVLAHRPISSSLVVEAQTLQLKRRRVNGYTYDAAKNVLTFSGVAIRGGHQIVAAYRRFKSSTTTP